MSCSTSTAPGSCPRASSCGARRGSAAITTCIRDRLLSLSEDLPVVSVAVDTRERIESMLEPVMRIKRKGLVTLERARLLQGDVGEVRVPEELGEAIKLTVYVAAGRRSPARPPSSRSPSCSTAGGSRG